MLNISFYHLTKDAIEIALPKLLEKILEGDNKVLIHLHNQEFLENIDKALWSVGGTRFIPHGSEADEHPEQQPVFLSTKDENPNSSNIIILNRVPESDFYKGFEKILVMFSDNDEEVLKSTRDFWRKNMDDKEVNLQYFQQDESGKWGKK